MDEGSGDIVSKSQYLRNAVTPHSFALYQNLSFFELSHLQIISFAIRYVNWSQCDLEQA